MSSIRTLQCLLLSCLLLSCGGGEGPDNACTASENADGTLTITCPDGASGTARWISEADATPGTEGPGAPASDVVPAEPSGDTGKDFAGDGDASQPVPDGGQPEGGDGEDAEASNADAEELDSEDGGSEQDAFGGDAAPSDIVSFDAADTHGVDVPSQVDADSQSDDPPGPDTSDSGPVSDSNDTGGPLAINCEGLAVCEDFESSTVGSGPDPASWEVVSPNCSGDGTIVVDDAFAHSGSQSIRVQSSGGYCNHVFASPTGSIGPVGEPLHGRFYVRFGTALDMAHITFVAMKDQVQDKDLRMGGQNEILMWNRELDDATLPELSPTGVSLSVKPPVNEWICIEFLVDGNAGTLSTWVDGVLIEGLVVDGVPTPDVDNQWLNMDWHPELVDARFGWESYGGVPMTLWYDDIVLSHSPIGCVD